MPPHELLVNPRAQSDIRQGMTLEVMGEGCSVGPLNPEMKRLSVKQQGDIKYPIEWTTLGEYLSYLEKRGIAPNVASFVGAATVRQNELGEADGDPTPEQLGRMRALVRQAMEEGVMGVGTSLIYPPGTFAEADELVALTTEAGRCGGMYISHMRSEGDRLIESIDELIEISRRSGGPIEIYHLKQAGRANWTKLDRAIARVEAARAAGLKITANMYTNTAGATGVAAALPPWVEDGGTEAMLKRLADPKIVARVKREMVQPGRDWENLYHHAGPQGVVLASLVEPSLKPLIGKTIADVEGARDQRRAGCDRDRARGPGPLRRGLFPDVRGQCPPADRASVDELRFGRGGVGARRRVPAVGDAPSRLRQFRRFLGRYVRHEKTVPLPEAIRRLSSLPASNLGIRDRGRL